VSLSCRRADSKPEPDSQLCGENGLQVRIQADKLDRARPSDDHARCRGTVFASRQPHVYAASRTTPNKAGTNQISICRSHGIPVHAQQLFGASDAWKAVARPDMAGEDPRFQMADELSPEGQTGFSVEVDSVEHHIRYDARRNQASVIGSRGRRPMAYISHVAIAALTTAAMRMNTSESSVR
jgi:hypothetical protein